jgi:hypothetical protein
VNTGFITRALGKAGFLIMLLLIALAPPAYAQAPPVQQQAIIGTWHRDSGGQRYAITFNPDFTGTLESAEGTSAFQWQLQSGMLSMNGGGETFSYQVVVTPETLTLTGGNLPGPVVWYRAQGGQQNPGGYPENYGGYSQPQYPASNPPQGGYGNQSGVPERPGQNDPGGLVGTWRSPDGLVRINGDGTAVMGGQRYRYAASGDVIVITGNDGSVQIPYQLNGDTLIVVINGQSVTLTRVVEGPPSVRPELVGKWAWIKVTNYSYTSHSSSERYLTLYADGTFEFYSQSSRSVYSGQAGTALSDSDQGTWSATETSITFNGRSHGTLNCTLDKRNHPKTGDPMIVIDGESFVTYSPRQPW